ncbi:hypothetical protein BJF83_20655 [Nocardiopsis sp. CNR-923]|uniref:hypothetical protein n=1 Tax=Nocardiopsis sp. CNR-923 TaxID=1904965 RepID=UPI0009663E7B|nr:hypothetical protein [Nocardiopsis sp. CNR-923]OLT26577.1 hypothetical protein BJF83_20655 [Nocardiopsis sp. CNR-923]
MPYPKHRPEVGHARVEDTPEGEAWIWRVQCACGQTAHVPHHHRLDAEAAADEHKAAVAPPENQRCREPLKHRTRWHDWCALCVDQAVLPGFENLTGVAG